MKSFVDMLLILANLMGAILYTNQTARTLSVCVVAMYALSGVMFRSESRK